MTGASRWILFTTIIVDARNHEPEICYLLFTVPTMYNSSATQTYSIIALFFLKTGFFLPACHAVFVCPCLNFWNKLQIFTKFGRIVTPLEGTTALYFDFLQLMSMRTWKLVVWVRRQLHLLSESEVVDSNVCFRNADQNFVKVTCLYHVK
jgi:hypothetical protein